MVFKRRSQPWGLVVAYVFDPSGVLWHFAESQPGIFDVNRAGSSIDCNREMTASQMTADQMAAGQMRPRDSSGRLAD
jgi:hypothetical protein